VKELIKPLMLAISLGPLSAAHAQTTDPDAVEAEVPDEQLLTQAELENLVAPVALYPDTLLIQILVAATVPFDLVKSDRVLSDNAGAEPEEIKAAIEAEGYDPSVEVLATAFPEVTTEMVTHIEWTETIGNAMLAQSDDVMAAVQTMRTQAINTGALISGEEQVIEVTQDENVIIQPTNPEVVYVPQYDPQVVYAQPVTNSNVVGDAIVTGAIAFGTFALIDAIFDDDDDWNSYWGCRNCGGWGGGPIYRNPDIDIDVNGNVNIGNRVDIDKTDIRNRVDRASDGSWKPNERKTSTAREKIAAKRGPEGATKLPIQRKPARSDELRNKLSAKSGAADIARPGALPALENRPSIQRPSARPDVAKKAAAAKTLPNRPQVNRPAAAKKPAIKKPATIKKPAAVKRPKATAKRAPANRAKAASRRGGGGGAKLRARR
jgi:hypothetical protein